MPLDMAVEKPHTRIIRLESQHHVPVRSHHKGVATHGGGGEIGVAGRVVVASVFVAAPDGLEGVAVEVEGVLAGVVVVDDYVDDVVVGEDEGVGEFAVDDGVGGVGAGGEGGVEGWHLWGGVADVVEEGAGRLVRGEAERER